MNKKKLYIWDHRIFSYFFQSIRFSIDLKKFYSTEKGTEKGREDEAHTQSHMEMLQKFRMLLLIFFKPVSLFLSRSVRIKCDFLCCARSFGRFLWAKKSAANFVINVCMCVWVNFSLSFSFLLSSSKSSTAKKS